MSIKYRIYRISHDMEIINAAFDYENEDRTGYYDYIWEHEAKDKAYELNQNQMQRQLSKFPEVEFWYRAIEDNE